MPKYWVCTHIWLYTYTFILLLDLLISGISYQLISSGAFFTLLTTPLVSLCYDYASILCCLLYAYVFPVESQTLGFYISFLMVFFFLDLVTASFAFLTCFVSLYTYSLSYIICNKGILPVHKNHTIFVKKI